MGDTYNTFRKVVYLLSSQMFQTDNKTKFLLYFTEFDYIVTCRPISRKPVDEHVSWDTKMKTTHCCGINRPVHVYERSTNVS
jgi:hypothetical protein